VLSIELADGREGVAHINYESNFAESCLIINEYDQHQTSLAFASTGMHLSSTSNCRSREFQ
jgi:hypothetical protein